RVDAAEDQGRRRRARRGRHRARDREADAYAPARPRLPRRDDANRARLPRRERRARPLLQPAPRGVDAADPRRRLAEHLAARRQDPAPPLPPRRDGRHLRPQPARRRARAARARRRHRRDRPRADPAKRPDRLQLGRLTRDPLLDRLRHESRRVAPAALGLVRDPRRTWPRRRHRCVRPGAALTDLGGGHGRIDVVHRFAPLAAVVLLLPAAATARPSGGSVVEFVTEPPLQLLVAAGHELLATVSVAPGPTAVAASVDSRVVLVVSPAAGALTV